MRKIGNRVIETFRILWQGIDQARRLVVNILFLAVLVALLAWWISDDTPDVPESTALVVDPYGDLVEQLSDDSEERTILALLGERPPETLLRPLLEAIELAADDDRVRALVLQTDRLGGGGLSKLQTLAEAIEGFKKSGKPVIATGEFYLQSQYYLAATADEIYLHPMGMVFAPGYGSYRNYYKEALEKLDIDWHIFRVGEFKSAVEPYMRSDMSPAVRESRQRWLGILWQAYREDVERRRGLEPGTLDHYATSLSRLLAEHGGDAGATAEALGLVDHLAHSDEVRQRLIELVGEDEDGSSFSRIGYREYHRATRSSESKSENKIAVVVARGGIFDGRRPPGSIGGDSTAQLVRRAREDESVRALVLRVDSPGGSAFASEIIRREVVLTREAGKPVVASMSSVAASGGYWISMSSDEIWAQPTTLTGSIGIYAMFPTFSRTLERLGVRNDGVGTGPLAGTLRPEQPLPEEAERAMELMIQEGYNRFIEGVAEGRDKPLADVDAIARGRVWAGSDAFEIGLVDKIGSLEEAIESTAELAGLDDDYSIEYVELQRGWRSRALDWLVRVIVMPILDASGVDIDQRLEIEAVSRFLDDLESLEEFGDPNGFYAYCFCEPY